MPTEERILVNKSRSSSAVAKPEAALSSDADVQHDHFAARAVAAAEDQDVGVQECPPSASTSTMFPSPAKPNSSPSPATNSSSSVAAVAISLIVPQPTTIQTSPIRIKKGHTKMNGTSTSPKKKIPPTKKRSIKISRDPSIVSIKGSSQPSSKSKGTSWLPTHQLLTNQSSGTSSGAAVNTAADGTCINSQPLRPNVKAKGTKSVPKKKYPRLSCTHDGCSNSRRFGDKCKVHSDPRKHCSWNWSLVAGEAEEGKGSTPKCPNVGCRKVGEGLYVCVKHAAEYDYFAPSTHASAKPNSSPSPATNSSSSVAAVATSLAVPQPTTIQTSPIRTKKGHTKMNGTSTSPKKHTRVRHETYATHATEYKNSLEDGSAKEKGVGFEAALGVSSPSAATAASKSTPESPDEDTPIMAAHKAKKQKEVSRPKKQTKNNDVSKKESGIRASLSSSATATAGVQQHHSQPHYPPPSSDVDGLSLLCSAVAHAAGDIQVKKEEEDNDSEDEDDDELGALIYNASRTAKARRDSTLPSDDTPNTAMPALRRDGSHSSTGIEALVEACTGRAAAMADLNNKESATEEPMRIGIKGKLAGPSKRESVASKLIQKKPLEEEKAKVKEKGKFKRPYNRYNVFFIFERERLVMSKGWKTVDNDKDIPDPPKHIERGYDNIQFPPNPPRFEGVEMARDWYIPWRKKKRRAHRKTHGAVSFNGLAKDIAASWKNIDPITWEWCTDMERILKESRDNLEKKYNTEVPKEKANQVGQPVASEGGPAKPSQVVQPVALTFGPSQPIQVDHAVTMAPEDWMGNVTFANKKSSSSNKREAPSDEIDGGSAKRRQYTNSRVCFVPGCSLYAQSGNVCAMHRVTSLRQNHNQAMMKGHSSSSSPLAGVENVEQPGAMNLPSNAPQISHFLGPPENGATVHLPSRGHPVMTQDNSTRAPGPSMNAARQDQATPPEAQNLPPSSARQPSLMARVAMISKAASELTQQMDMKILKLAMKYPAILEEKAMAEIHHDVLPKLMMVSSAAHVASTKKTQQAKKKTHSQGLKTQEITQYQAPRTKGSANPAGILCQPVGLLVGKQMSGGDASSTMHFVNHNNTAGSSFQAPSNSTQCVNGLPNSNTNNTRVIPPTRLSNVVSDYGGKSTEPNSNGSDHPSPVPAPIYCSVDPSPVLASTAALIYCSVDGCMLHRLPEGSSFCPKHKAAAALIYCSVDGCMLHRLPEGSIFCPKHKAAFKSLSSEPFPCFNNMNHDGCY